MLSGVNLSLVESEVKIIHVESEVKIIHVEFRTHAQNTMAANSKCWKGVARLVIRL